MLFNSFSFLVFFAVVTTGYFVLPHRYRWMLLLVASCIFYMAFIPAYILILFLTIAIDYYAGIKIEENKNGRKQVYLIISIVSTCLVLIVFKYANFIFVNINDLAQFLHWNYSLPLLGIILPIGLSFHTFQSLSYVIEVYRGKQKAEKNFGIYSLYVMFYPQLVAGPIERPQNLLHQFYTEHRFEYARVTAGLQRMLWGFIKKIVVADNLAFYVNKVYDAPHSYSGLVFVVATVFFAVQIYCDFSGYSDIAIGCAQVMGFTLMTNFKNPYFSLSVTEFWSRWHISLSTWFRDYVYIPLGGNRVGRAKWVRNILITFLISGFWHGANWTYIIWGFLHGMYVVLGVWVDTLCKRIPLSRGKSVVLVGMRWLSTFVLVSVAWVFFRAKTVGDALFILSESFKSIFLGNGFHAALTSIISPLPSFIYLMAFLLTTVVFFAMELVDYRSNLIETFRKQPAWLRWGVYALALLAIMNLGVTKTVPFIYFQF